MWLAADPEAPKGRRPATPHKPPPFPKKRLLRAPKVESKRLLPKLKLPELSWRLIDKSKEILRKVSSAKAKLLRPGLGPEETIKARFWAGRAGFARAIAESAVIASVAEGNAGNMMKADTIMKALSLPEGMEPADAHEKFINKMLNMGRTFWRIGKFPEASRLMLQAADRSAVLASRYPHLRRLQKEAAETIKAMASDIRKTFP